MLELPDELSTILAAKQQTVASAIFYNSRAYKNQAEFYESLTREVCGTLLGDIYTPCMINSHIGVAIRNCVVHGPNPSRIEMAVWYNDKKGIAGIKDGGEYFTRSDVKAEWESLTGKWPARVNVRNSPLSSRVGQVKVCSPVICDAKLIFVDKKQGALFIYSDNVQLLKDLPHLGKFAYTKPQ